MKNLLKVFTLLSTVVFAVVWIINHTTKSPEVYDVTDEFQ